MDNQYIGQIYTRKGFTYLVVDQPERGLINCLNLSTMTIRTYYLSDLLEANQDEYNISSNL